MTYYYIKGRVSPAVTAIGDSSYGNIQAFKNEVNVWLNDHNMMYEWRGELSHFTSSRPDGAEFHYGIRLINVREEDVTLFNMRWG